MSVPVSSPPSNVYPNLQSRMGTAHTSSPMSPPMENQIPAHGGIVPPMPTSAPPAGHTGQLNRPMSVPPPTSYGNIGVPASPVTSRPPPFDKPFDKPYDKPYDKPMDKSLYDKPYHDKPYEKMYDKPYDKLYDKPFDNPFPAHAGGGLAGGGLGPMSVMSPMSGGSLPGPGPMPSPSLASSMSAMSAAMSAMAASPLVVPQPLKMTRPNKTYHCRMCDQEFPTRAGMQRHAVEIHHVQEKTHKCEKCFKAFPSSQQLTQHMLVHNNIRKYKCTYCDKSFKQLSHLQQHHRRHTGERPYKCMVEACGKAFAQLSNLQQHLRNHDSRKNNAERKPYLCQVCDRRFATEASLNNHISKDGKCLPTGVSEQGDMLHDGVMMHHMPDRKCGVCGKEYQSDERYLRHIHKLHPEHWEQFSGGRPLEALIPHREVIQHREKRFTCSVCRKQYSHETGYLKHMATHPENAGLKMRLWTCSVCQKVFTKETYLERHMEMKLDPEHSDSLHEFRRRMIERQNMQQEGLLPMDDSSGLRSLVNSSLNLDPLPGPSYNGSMLPPPVPPHKSEHDTMRMNGAMSPLRIPHPGMQSYSNGHHQSMGNGMDHMNENFSPQSPRNDMVSPSHHMSRPGFSNMRPEDRFRHMNGFQDDPMKHFQTDQMKRFAEEQMKRIQETEMKRFADEQMKRFQDEQFKRFQDNQMKRYDDPFKRYQEDSFKRFDPMKPNPISRSLSFDQVDRLRLAPLPPLLPPLAEPPMSHLSNSANLARGMPSSQNHMMGSLSSGLMSNNLLPPAPRSAGATMGPPQPFPIGPPVRSGRHTPMDQEEIVSALQCLAESMS